MTIRSPGMVLASGSERSAMATSPEAAVAGKLHTFVDDLRNGKEGPCQWCYKVHNKQRRFKSGCKECNVFLCPSITTRNCYTNHVKYGLPIYPMHGDRFRDHYGTVEKESWQAIQCGTSAESGRVSPQGQAGATYFASEGYAAFKKSKGGGS